MLKFKSSSTDNVNFQYALFMRYWKNLSYCEKHGALNIAVVDNNNISGNVQRAFF